MVSMELGNASHHVRRAVADSTGLNEEEIGFLIVAAAVATALVVAVRAVDVVSRLWAPSGGRG